MDDFDLAGSIATTGEQRARDRYPYVTWEHPQLYPGLMVPVWATKWREAFDNAGAPMTGRALLRYVKKLYPNPDETMVGLRARLAKGPRERERTKRANEIVRAVFVVLSTTSAEALTQQMERVRIVSTCLDLLENAGAKVSSQARSDLTASSAGIP